MAKASDSLVIRPLACSDTPGVVGLSLGFSSLLNEKSHLCMTITAGGTTRNEPTSLEGCQDYHRSSFEFMKNLLN